MIQPRETYASALLAAITTMQQDPALLLTFRTISRDWINFDETELEGNLDALFLLDNGETATGGRSMPAKYDLHFDVIFQVLKPLPPTFPSVKLNPLIDALENLFQPWPGGGSGTDGGPDTLGGLVEKVWIEGQIVKNFAFLGGNVCLAAVPIHLRVTNPR